MAPIFIVTKAAGNTNKGCVYSESCKIQNKIDQR